MESILAELETYEARLRAAMLASDVVELEALIADDLAFVGPNGKVATKAEDLELHRTRRVSFQSIELSDRHSRGLNGAVFTTVQAQLVVTVDGQRVEGLYRYVRVWRMDPSGWQIIGGGVSSVLS